ncbi:hypothetical protein PR048_003956 [Dryococelus australis]|uniref:Uncharacterized protein n=1 Tax=Dryococelus australis TaxID=614101 RepID=A0ABQ9I627_9NEOP|nr:hypothetical protein PR048_003956 [Dryococelus australis]
MPPCLRKWMWCLGREVTNDLEVLTPGHFLSGTYPTAAPSQDLSKYERRTVGGRKVTRRSNLSSPPREGCCLQGCHCLHKKLPVVELCPLPSQWHFGFDMLVYSSERKMVYDKLCVRETLAAVSRGWAGLCVCQFGYWSSEYKVRV